MEGLFFYEVMDHDAVPRRVFFGEDIIAQHVENTPDYHVFFSTVEIVPFKILAGGVLYLVGQHGDVGEI